MRTVGACLVMLCLAANAWCQASDWPAWRGPNGNGTTSATDWSPLALKNGAKVAWKADVGLGYSSVAVLSGKVHALGKSRTTPVLDGGRLFSLTSNGVLFCLSQADGSLAWKTDLADARTFTPVYTWSASPVIVGNVLLLAANNRALGYDKTTGKLLWAVDDPRQEKYASPDTESLTSCAIAVVGGRHIASFVLTSTLFAIEPATGMVSWSRAFANPGANHDPVVLGDAVLVVDWGMALRKGTRGTVREVWSSPVTFASWPGPALINGHLYGTTWPTGFFPTSWGAFDRTFPFACVRADTGAVVWSVDRPWESVLAAGGKIISMEIKGRIHVYDATPTGLVELSSADVYARKNVPRTFAAAPVLAGGRLYCRNYNGDLICVDMR
jgi:outer membrane protein assembly factor BamB